MENDVASPLDLASKFKLFKIDRKTLGTTPVKIGSVKRYIFTVKWVDWLTRDDGLVYMNVKLIERKDIPKEYQITNLDLGDDYIPNMFDAAFGSKIEIEVNETKLGTFCRIGMITKSDLAYLPDKCPKCNSELNSIMNEKIICPKCKEKSNV